MAISQVQGPMLVANLERFGVDFAVETDLLYFDVGNGRIGIQTSSPSQALEVVGGATVDNLSLTTNTISSVDTNGDITIAPDGTGEINLNADTTISGVSPDFYINDSDTGVNGGRWNISVDGTVFTMKTVEDASDTGSAFLQATRTSSTSTAISHITTLAPQVRTAAGSASAPVIAFASDTDTGLYFLGSDQVALATGGTQRLLIAADGSLSVAGTTDYETLVTDDDDVPNKKYVDDTITSAVSGAGHISNIVEDTSPQLGANLDVNDFNITNDTAFIQLRDANSTIIRAAGTFGATTGRELSLEGGNGTNGGAVNISGGDGSSGTGGNVILETGTGNSGAGASGLIILRPGLTGTTTPYVLLDTATSSSYAAELRFAEGKTNGSNYVSLTVPDAITTSRAWTLPIDDASAVAGQFLTTNSSGELSFAAGADVFKVGTPVNDQVGVWTGDGTIEGTTGLTYNGTDLNITGNITLSGTVDGIDIATDVAANTAKVTNATHTGQVTGATALALDVSAITAQPAAGAVVGTDTMIINDGGVLSEVTANQLATFFNSTGGDVFKVGTPVNNELAVWTGDGTLEGESGLTYDSSRLTLTGDLTVGGLDGISLDVGATNNSIIHWKQATVQRAYIQYLDAGDIFLINGGSLASVEIRAGNLPAITIDTSQHVTFVEKVTFDASTTADPSFNIPEGVAPTSPVDGDVWITSAGAFNARLNGATVDLTDTGGDVFKVGTPADDQVAVWTGDGTAEGTSGLTYNGTALNITGNITLSGTVDGVDIATRDHDAVTFAGTGTYISLSGQEITVDPITISDISDFGTYAEISGTPADNRIAVWTGATDIEGDANLTWNGSILAVTGTTNITGALTTTLNITAGANIVPDVTDANDIGSASVGFRRAYLTDFIEISDTDAQVRWEDTAGALDQKNWFLQATGEGFEGRIYDDALSNNYQWMNLERSGTGASVQVDTIDLTAATDITLNSTTIINGDLDPNANNTRDQGADALRWATIYATTFDGTATTAQYADLAEKYEADAEYEVGTVVCFGGSKEITVSKVYQDHRVAGIVSAEPAYLMNNSMENGTVVALRGRIPCKVKGTIWKGDLLISAGDGYACAVDPMSARPGTILGKALEDFSGNYGVIEVVV